MKDFQLRWQVCKHADNSTSRTLQYRQLNLVTNWSVSNDSVTCEPMTEKVWSDWVDIPEIFTDAVPNNEQINC
jgi:hypothetical protein